MYVTVVADLSRLDIGSFWFVMDNRNWIYPFDHKGARQPHTAIPRSIDGLVDDPFRSLGREVYAAPAASPRTRRFTANSSGPIFCAAA